MHLAEGDLVEAVRRGRRLSDETGHPFIWLCVTNAGVDYINQTYLYLLNLLDDARRYATRAGWSWEATHKN